MGKLRPVVKAKHIALVLTEFSGRGEVVDRAWERWLPARGIVHLWTGKEVQRRSERKQGQCPGLLGRRLWGCRPHCSTVLIERPHLEPKPRVPEGKIEAPAPDSVSLSPAIWLIVSE